MFRIFWLIIAIFFSALFPSQDALNKVPAGYVSKVEHMDQNGFQDYTDYCKYVYSSAEIFENHGNYKTATEEDAEMIDGYFRDFYSWMATEERLSEFDFDFECINAGDLFDIELDNYFSDYDNYTVWFFDKETCTLYYIHQNI